MGRIPRGQPSADAAISRTQQTIPSGRNLLDVFIQPAGGATRKSMLICHGIGDVVSQWYPIQRLFAVRGIASLVFDYSGYGRSTGRIDWNQCEQDAIAAFARLQEISPQARFLSSDSLWERVSLPPSSIASQPIAWCFAPDSHLFAMGHMLHEYQRCSLPSCLPSGPQVRSCATAPCLSWWCRGMETGCFGCRWDAIFAPNAARELNCLFCPPVLTMTPSTGRKCSIGDQSFPGC
jgi:hypothetical protein